VLFQDVDHLHIILKACESHELSEVEIGILQFDLAADGFVEGDVQICQQFPVINSRDLQKNLCETGIIQRSGVI